MSELPRELSFQPTKPTVGPNVGPGSYTNSIKKDTFSSNQAPFGTSTRRRLNLPHLEIIQDLTHNFRILPDAKQLEL
jgi:hypothetical protein